MQHFPEHDALFEGLPIVRVTDWSTVTPTFLDAEWERIQQQAARGELAWTKVHFPHWFAQLTGHMSPDV